MNVLSQGRGARQGIVAGDWRDATTRGISRSAATGAGNVGASRAGLGAFGANRPRRSLSCMQEGRHLPGANHVAARSLIRV